MQLVVPGVDKEADGVGALEQQVAGDPRERGEPVEQEDDNVAEEEASERQLPKLLEIDFLNPDQPEGSAAVDEQAQRQHCCQFRQEEQVVKRKCELVE